MTEAIRDGNFVTVALGVSNASATTPLPFKIDSVTGRLLTDSAGGSGTVTSVSVTSANGFAGTVATATTTPAITISTTINSPVLAGNGTAISAATTTGSGSTVVLATAPTFPTNITVGAAAGATGDILLKGTTSGTVTLTVADAAGTWQLTLPATDGDSGQVLTTNGSGVTTWETPAGGGNVSNTGTPVDNQIAVWTSATVIEGTAGLTYDGANLLLTGDIGATATRITKGWFTDLQVTNAIAGSITGTAAIATTVTVADEAADTSCFVNFTTAATGNLGVKSNAGLTFNSSTGALTATSFVGSVTGNAATVTFANEATDTSCFVAFATAASGNLEPKTNANLTFNSNTGVFTSASAVLTTADINGGSVDGATIGASSASTIVGTTITANTSFLPDADGGAALGSATLGFSILGLASASTINFANGNVLLTHSSGILTVTTGDLRVTTAGTNTASVVTVGGTQTLTSKTLTSPTITTATLSGSQTFAEGAGIAYDAASSADGVYTGFTRAGTAGATLAFGDLVYLSSVDSRWELADADAATTADRFLGMCVLAAAADGDPTTILLTGFIRADAAFPAMTIGSALYVGETAGDIQVAIPTGADNVIRRVGYAWTADELYFNPSMDSQITVA